MCEVKIMETTSYKDARKHFSKIGLVLFLGTLIIYAIQTIASEIVMNVPVIAENSNLSFLAGMLPMYIIAFPIIFLMFQKIPVQISGEKMKMKVSHLIVAFFIAYAGSYVCNLLGNMVTMIVGVLKQNPVDNVMLDVIGSINPLVNFLVVVICAPIMEELMFRKMIVDRTASYGEGVSVIFSGLLFGLFHGNLVQFAYAFLLGAFFGYIYIKTKNIVYPIILHMLINFLGSFVSSLLIDASGYMELMEIMASDRAEAELLPFMMDHIVGLALFVLYTMALMGFVLAGIILFFVNLKKFKFETGEVPIEKGQKFKTVILNLGVILFSAFWIIQIIIQLLA